MTHFSTTKSRELISLLVLTSCWYKPTPIPSGGIFTNSAKGSCKRLPILTALLTMYIEKKPIKPMLKWAIYYPLFMGSWILINIKCLFKQDIAWEKIDHVRSVDIKEIA